MTDEVLYLVAVRTREPEGGVEVRAALDALNEVGALPKMPVEHGPYEAIALARPYLELSSQHHAALVTLGYTWDEANRLVTVASEGTDE